MITNPATVMRILLIGGYVVNDIMKKKSTGLWVKICVPLLIVLVVAGIYIYKKAEVDKQNTQNLLQDNSAKSEEKGLPLEISSIDLNSIKSYRLPFVIDFGSDSCVPCKQMEPVLEKLHKEWQGRAIVQFVDVWKYTTAANNFPITVIPTQVFFNADGTPFVPSEKLAKEIELTMYTSKDTNQHIYTIHQGGLTEVQMRKIFTEMGVK